MTVQETILLELQEDIRAKHIQRQIETANGILRGFKKRIRHYTLVTLPVESIVPSQTGEDYENVSSKYDAETYKLVKEGAKKVDEVRLESFYPIVVDKSSLEIIDGNHRHYAAVASGEAFIYVVLCEVEPM
jgi:hypothetical protein